MQITVNFHGRTIREISLQSFFLSAITLKTPSEQVLSPPTIGNLFASLFQTCMSDADN